MQEGRRIVWRHGKFVPGVPGIQGGSDAGDWIKFDVGSGPYSFKLVGSQH